MKIFVTSDTHNNHTILGKLKKFLSENSFDYTIHCGDIGGSGSFGQTLLELSRQQLEDFQYFKKHFPDMLFILGNDDWFDLKDDRYINSSRSENKKLGIPINYFIGFELVKITPFTTNREANENKIAYELSNLGNDFRKSVIVAHDPPYECLDRVSSGQAVGSKSIRRFIELNQPKLWLCGHIHESFGVSNIGATGVFNCACRPDLHQLRGWVIDLETFNYEKIII